MKTEKRHALAGESIIITSSINAGIIYPKSPVFKVSYVDGKGTVSTTEGFVVLSDEYEVVTGKSKGKSYIDLSEYWKIKALKHQEDLDILKELNKKLEEENKRLKSKLKSKLSAERTLKEIGKSSLYLNMEQFFHFAHDKYEKYLKDNDIDER